MSHRIHVLHDRRLRYMLPWHTSNTHPRGSRAKIILNIDHLRLERVQGTNISKRISSLISEV